MKILNLQVKYVQYTNNNIQEIKDFINELKENYLIAVQENQDGEIKGVHINFTKMQGKGSRGSIFLPESGYLVLDAEDKLIAYKAENFEKKFVAKEEKKNEYDFSRKTEHKTYFYTNSMDEVVETHENGMPFDEKCFETGNYYPSEEIAEKFAKIQELQRKLLQFSLENGMSEIDWNDGSNAKYSIKYNDIIKDFEICENYCTKYINEIYFKNKETAQKALELLEQQIEEVDKIKW